MVGPLTFLDIALIAVALLSALLAMYRGLTREILSILSWIVAGAAVLYFVIFQKAFASDIGNQIGLPTQIAQILIGAIIFLIVLVVVHLVTSRMSDSILDSRVGMIDRIMGFVFGLVRGFILIVIPFLFYEKLYPSPETHPQWIRESRSLPYIRWTGDGFQSLLLNYMPATLTDPGPEPGPEPDGAALKSRQIKLTSRDLQTSCFHISVTSSSGMARDVRSQVPGRVMVTGTGRTERRAHVSRFSKPVVCQA